MTDQPPLWGPERDIRTVVIDPPWDSARGGGKIKRGADRHYPLLSAEDTVRVIQTDCEPWRRLRDDAHLYLWATNTALADGDAHYVARHLGFRPITLITWAKDRIGLGQYFRGKTEQILFCVRGEFTPTEGTHSTLIEAPRGEHSAKPTRAYEIIEEASPGAYLDIFARRERDGWTVWGNEVQ